MSIVAGFGGSLGKTVVLCADKQETVGGYAKRSVEKIKLWLRGPQDGEFQHAVGAATDSGPYADMLMSSISGSINEFENYEPEKIEKAIGECLAEFHSKHLWPRGNESPLVEALIVLHPTSGHESPCLFHTSASAVNRVERRCIGVGSYLADFILDRTLSQMSDDRHLIAASAHMLKEVRENIEGCGKEGIIYLFKRNGQVEIVEEDSLRAIEENVEAANDLFRYAFQYITEVDSPYLGTEEGKLDLLKKLEGFRAEYWKRFEEEREKQRQMWGL